MNLYAIKYAPKTVINYSYIYMKLTSHIYTYEIIEIHIKYICHSNKFDHGVKRNVVIQDFYIVFT